MPTINHTITVTINGTDRTSKLLKDSLYIRTSIGNKGDTASFVLRNDDGAYSPLDWDEVAIAVNGTNVFGGYIINRKANGVGSGSAKVAHWNIECKDWTVLFDQTIVNYGYTDTADADILNDLFDRYLSTEGFDENTNVTEVDSDVDVFFENITFREALNTLAATAKANWHVAPDKSLYWYSPTAPANAAFNIDVVAPNDSTTFDVLTDSLRYSSDASTIVNRVRIIGGEESGAKTSNLFDADGTASRFGPLTYKPGSIWLISYIVDDDGDDVTRYAYPTAIGFEPEDSLFDDGGFFYVLANLDERYVIIQEEGGVVPKAATSVGVTYYPLTQVDVTVNDEASQSEYGRVFEQTSYDESLNTSSATQYGENILDEYAYGRETISFEVTEHGLLPGRLITVNAPVLGFTSTYNDALALENRADVLLLEDGTSRLMLENYGVTRKYLIQDVSIRTVVTSSDRFMVIASVSCGKYVPTLLDSLSQIQQFSAGTNRLPARRSTGSLDRISNNLGEIVAGRATFTDGGTAVFTWENYADHTGVVIGLEDTDVDPYGAMYILQDGTVKAKVGRMDGLGTVGGVAPSGWGIWTENGYFSGVIAASMMIGGTIATTTMPINSSNPGVYMTSAGLFAYGTLGLTFSLPSDPAQRPIFSSGTILNTVYEITTTSVIRTGTVNPRIQIDNSGMFAYNSGGTLKFSVDTSTGRLTASDGIFSGSVSASTITGGTVTGGFITGGTVNAAQMVGGTITAGRFSGGTISAAVFTGGTTTAGTISASVISGGTVSSSLFSGGTVNLGSGSVVMTSTGLSYTQSGTAGVYSDTNPTFIKMSNAGSVVWYDGSYVSGVVVHATENIGIQATLQGEKIIQANGGVFGSQYSKYTQNENGWTFNVNGGNRMLITDGTVTAGGAVEPDASSNNRVLGGTTRGWRYLYLYDGTDEWRIEINTSGVLVTTKM
jgi:hypothetical protein